ncbi:DUF456 domain-containing protein [Formosa sp. S-31]|uniref:DUF456 domain-containing protein n=1 Tax=Formosa sp. S-31 TaxID=2790949 RepID=UPI003EBC53A4
MDIALLLLGFVFMLIGILGSVLPVLPGPPISWLGLLLLYFTKAVPNDWWFLGITFCIALGVFILDYAIPAMGTKRFGGSKAGVIGTTTGLIISILFPLLGFFGIIIWPFVGAFIGELINKTHHKAAAKAAFGSFLGFITGTFLKFIITVIYLGLFVRIFWKFKNGFSVF